MSNQEGGVISLDLDPCPVRGGFRIPRRLQVEIKGENHDLEATEYIWGEFC